MIASCFTISGNGCEPSTFIIMDDHRVFVHNAELGLFPHKWHAFSRELSDHIAEMVLDGFTIKPATKKQIAQYTKYIKEHFGG